MPSLTADKVDCSLVACDELACEYYVNKGWATLAREVATNYPWFLYNTWKSGLDMVVLDEAHLANEAVIDFCRVRLDKRELRIAGVDIHEPLGDLLKKGIHNLSVQLGRIAHVNTPVLMEKLTNLVNIRNKMERGLLVVGTGKFYLYRRDDVLIIQPEDEAGLLEKLIFSRTKHWYQRDKSDRGKVLLMSATILDPEVFMRDKGLGHLNTEYVELSTTIPAYRRAIFYQPTVWLSRRSTDADYATLANKVDEILARHCGQRGLIHTANFELGRRLVGLLNEESRDRIVLQANTSMRREAFTTFLNDRTDKVLVSPSATTGLDLHDDLGRFAIFAKIPFPNLGDERVKRKMKDGGQQWYNWFTVCEIVQGSGRVSRGKSDWGLTYIIDSTFEPFYERNKHLFPGWWKEALVMEG
jgi:Rad3-related DNA helicase